MSSKDVLKYRDAWMGFAILWVAFFHSGLEISGTILSGIKTFGFGGVDVFLFASGIGCWYSLEKNHDTLDFAGRRAKRLLPTYECFMLLWIAVQYYYGSMNLTAAIGNIFCIQNFTGKDYAFNWYISAIWLMYILAPYFFFFLKRAKAYQSVILILLLLLLSVAFWHSDVLIITMTRIPVFFLGMCFAKAGENRILHWKDGLLLFFVMICGIVIALLCYSLLRSQLWSRGLWWYPFLLISPGMCVTISAIANRLERVKLGRILLKSVSVIGRNSFELYLIHIFVFDIFRKLMEKEVLPNNNTVWLYSIIPIIILVIVLKKSTALVCRIFRTVSHPSPV